MMIQYSWWLGGHCELRVLQGAREGTVAFCLDMGLWNAGTVHHVKGKGILLIFILQATYCDCPAGWGHNQKSDTCYTTHQCFLNSQMYVWMIFSSYNSTPSSVEGECLIKIKFSLRIFISKLNIY